VRQGPENRRLFLTNLMTDVDPTSADVIERFTRILSQRNALLRALAGDRPSPSQQSELDVWTSDFCNVSDELIAFRIRLLDDITPLVANYYHELAGDDALVELSYERSWHGELEHALHAAFDDDRFRGHTTIGPQRDDIAIHLNGRDTRRQASQGEQRSLALALRLAGHELVQQRRGVDPLLLLDDVFSELDPMRSDRLLNLLPTGQTLVTTASPLPTAMHPAAVIDLTKFSR
jgi:DNA replication and repair protein RecF